METISSRSWRVLLIFNHRSLPSKKERKDWRSSALAFELGMLREGSFGLDGTSSGPELEIVIQSKNQSMNSMFIEIGE